MFLESADARLIGLIAALVATALCGIFVARGAAGRRQSAKRMAREIKPEKSSWPQEKEALELHNSSGMPQVWKSCSPWTWAMHVIAPSALQFASNADGCFSQESYCLLLCKWLDSLSYGSRTMEVVWHPQIL